MPPGGEIHSAAESAQTPGVAGIDKKNLVPGPSAGVYAFYRITIQRNLYRIPFQ
jgi:hypothetical protein